MNARFPTSEPLGREKLGERTLEFLRDLVVDGYFHEDERLNEVEIAASLGVSRGPVREAFQRLGTDGLLDLIPHRGAFVPSFSLTELANLYEVRTALETMATRLAAKRGSEEDIADLCALLDTTKKILNSGEQVPYPVDLDFHRKILATSGNSQLLAHAEKVHLQLTLARSRSGYQPARAREAYEEHIGIADAITKRDAEAAEQAMRRHLERSFANVQTLFTAPVDPAPPHGATPQESP